MRWSVSTGQRDELFNVLPARGKHSHSKLDHKRFAHRIFGSELFLGKSQALGMHLNAASVQPKFVINGHAWIARAGIHDVAFGKLTVVEIHYTFERALIFRSSKLKACFRVRSSCFVLSKNLDHARRLTMVRSRHI